MNSTELCYLPAVQLAAAIRAKQISPVEVTRAVLDRIAKLNPRLNAFCTVSADAAMQSAREAEAAVMRGDPLGLLHGVPISIKDLLLTQGVRATFGSKLFEHNIASEDSPVVERLRRAGAILLGQTNTPEFGWKGVTDNRVYGITRNPWNTELTPGGSSGGAASAVAAGLGPIGIGTDGGGSIRIPASFCELVGLKASFGRVPNYPATGVDSLRHTGPLTRTVADAALTLDVLAGADERDPHSLPDAPRHYLAQLDQGIRGLRVGYSPDLGFAAWVDPEVATMCADAARLLSLSGATVESVSLNWKDPYELWTVFFYGGIAARVANGFAEKKLLMDPGLVPVAERGLALTGVDYVNALVARNALWQQVRGTFERYDLLITPALAVPPFQVGRDRPEFPKHIDSTGLKWSPFTYLFNLTGQPAISVPCGHTRTGLPVGLQMVGRRFADMTVLRAARAWEQIQPWAERRPHLD